MLKTETTVQFNLYKNNHIHTAYINNKIIKIFKYVIEYKVLQNYLFECILNI